MLTNAQGVVARALEPVRHQRRHHEDVASGDGALLVAEREGAGARLDQEHLGVRVRVQGRTFIPRELGHEDRQRHVVPTFEQHGARAAPEVLDRNDPRRSAHAMRPRPAARR
jgi:hypothetical protein